MGFHPPPIVAKELNAQYEAMRSGLTPRQSIEPPREIKQAVEHAKAEAEYILRTPKALHRIQRSGKPITNPFLYTPVHGNQSPRNLQAAPDATSTSGNLPKPLMMNNGDGRPQGPPIAGNGYSMGNSMPTGVSWRYVDVLQNPDVLK